MRLMTGERRATPRTTPVVIVPAPHDPIGAQQEDDDLDDEDINADQFINTSFEGDDLFMPPVEGAYQHDEEACGPADPAAKPACSTRPSLLLRRCFQQLAPSPSLKKMPQGDLFSDRPHSIRRTLSR